MTSNYVRDHHERRWTKISPRHKNALREADELIAELKANGVSALQVTDAIAEEWGKLQGSDELARAYADTEVDAVSVGKEPPFEAEPGEDGYGVVELILIAVAARLLSVIPEKLLGKVFDEVMWPRLKARFGSSLTRSEDG